MMAYNLLAARRVFGARHVVNTTAATTSLYAATTATSAFHYRFSSTPWSAAEKYSTTANGTIMKPHFDKILIANRGEIACRVMKTARRLNVKTVAVYSEADKNSMHVQQADEAVLIGPPPSAESYLQMDRIIKVAKATGAKAIHPGYGFLSENAIFAEKCANNGIVFIGPPSSAIRAMGSKSESKKIMTDAQVPVVPGYHGDDQSTERLKAEADRIGYPVLIKAVMGGGGKGMRIVERPEDFESKLESSRRESKKSFGDDKVLIEKYLVRPRHVEVQVFADTLGNAVYLYERDCSVQRRHQKVLEEAPAPGLSEEKRTELGTQAVNAARAVNYVGAGTVEFIMDATTGTFYFMEMNTRLQVEHPVTEMVTGLDLVEWQLLVGAGNPIPLKQSEIPLRGHSFEARIYAENPENNFLPDIGKLVHISTPKADDPSRIRVETGVRQGDEVGIFYDPMIAKLVVWDQDRASALRSMSQALESYKVVGPSTNLEFLHALANHHAFQAGDVETNFIEKYRSELLPAKKTIPDEVIAQSVLSLVLRENQATLNNRRPTDPYSPIHTLVGFRLNTRHHRTIQLNLGETMIPIEVVYNRDGSYDLSWKLDGKEHRFTNVTASLEPDNAITVEIDNHLTRGTVVIHHDKIHSFFGGKCLKLSMTEPKFIKHEVSHHAGSILTPMPCKITQLNVKPGQAVKKGDTLIVLEAMKMEHVITAPFDGVIERVNYKVGDLVPEKKEVVVFADSGENKKDK